MLNIMFNADHAWIKEELMIVDHAVYINRVDQWVRAPIPENISELIILPDTRHIARVKDSDGCIYSLLKDEDHLVVTAPAGKQTIHRFDDMKESPTDIGWAFDVINNCKEGTLTHECVGLFDGSLYVKINSEWYFIPYVHKFKSMAISENNIITTTPYGSRQRLEFHDRNMTWVVFSKNILENPTAHDLSYGKFVESSLNYSRFNKKAKKMISCLNSDLELRRVNINSGVVRDVRE